MSSAMPAGHSSPAATEGAFQQTAISAECPIFPNREPIAANADPITSHQAAEEITRSGKRTSEKRKVLAALKEEPLHITSMELAHRMHADRYMVAKRLPDLAEDGLVERCPARNCAITGRKAITWRAAR